VKDLTTYLATDTRSQALTSFTLVVESVLQQLTQEEKRRIEEDMIEAYQHWILEGSYLDEQEQASVIAELAILYLKHYQLLEAVELVLNHGWLLYALKHAQRIARVADSSIRSLPYSSKRN